MDVSEGNGSSSRSVENVAALIRGYAAPRTVAEVERDAGLKPGSLANYVKPSTAPARMPLAPVMERIADALGAPVTEVSRAFAADFELPVYDGEPLPEDETELLAQYRMLPPNLRRFARKTVASLVAEVGASRTSGEIDEFDVSQGWPPSELR
ncbi:hypothetical protein [Amycolatopsis vastitatis]|uniref:Uncharacterized protein n=1 Tax=Amycolatopsis vastitatis TaxID=1905142 RepID=A0A229SX95_9PSEU|nr:hypothetical protein [Amycolatopsis vastitatis]OXM63119.1 hypothetical protein CF165_32700 [Amycolatopsis vastitatis]